MFRKMLAILLVFGALLTVYYPQQAIAAEPITISVLFNNTETSPYQKDWRILTEYAKRKNIVLDIRTGDDKDFTNAIILTLDSGNIPDVILKCYPNIIESYAYKGVLLPISDYEDLMPYYKTYIKENSLQDEVEKLKLNNGKYYILPGYQREMQVQQWIYRKDAFAKNNLEPPTTYDELFNSLVELKRIYPDSAPLTASWGGAHLLAMMGAGYGIPAGWAGSSLYDAPNNQWLFSPATDNYRELYRFLNRCYSAGVLDPLTFTQTNDEFLNKLQSGSAFVTVTWITSGFSAWNAKLRENGVIDGEWVPLPVPESTIGIKALPAVDPFRKGLVVSAAAASKPYFKELISFLDWAVYSREGMDLTTWGVEGLTYTNTADGKAYLSNIKTSKNPQGTLDVVKEYGFNCMFNLNENATFEDYKKPPEIVEFLAASQQAHETAQFAPLLKLSTSDNTIISVINEKLTPYINETSTNFITGKLSIETDWDQYLVEITNLGYKIIEKVWNDAWLKQNIKE